MTVEQALTQGTAAIGRRDALLLLSHAAALDTAAILLHGEYVLSPSEETLFIKMLDKRRAHMPVQYILGHWSFMGLEFIVDKRALIPRPDTEILVEAALTFISQYGKKPVRVLDVCTGSGCIGIALAHFSGAEVTAVDISPEALALARENAAALGAAERMRWAESDLFQGLPEQLCYDVIVSNPPYIASGEVPLLDTDVRDYEPRLALDGGADGLSLYRRLIPESTKYLRPGGALFLEIGPCEGVLALMRQAGFTNVQVLQDYAGLNRVIYGNREQ